MKLGEFDSSASAFEGFLGCFCVVFGGLFEDGLWSTINDSLSFAEAEAGDVLNCLDNSDFLSTCVLEDNIVFALFVFSGCAAFCWGCCYSYCCGCWLNAVLVFEDASEFVDFQYGKTNELFCNFL